MTHVFHSYTSKEDGAITVFNLFAFSASCMLLGLSLDVANAYKVRTELQIAVDTASHAALYTRGTETADDARQKALQVAGVNLNEVPGSGSVRVTDINFGVWDEDTRTFVPSTSSRSAVRVTAERTSDRDNGVGTFLLGFVGLNEWDIRTVSVAATYRPACLREGFAADGVVDIQSNNGFYNGFCLHSNDHISVNQNNFFEAGTVVSMPNSSAIDLPASGFVQNDGLLEALRDAFYQIRIVDHIDDIILSLVSGSPDYRPDYVMTSMVSVVSGKTVGPDDLPAGGVYRLACNQGNKVTLSAGVYEKVVVIANCPVTFANGAILEDVVFGNTSTNSQSFYASHLQIGQNDDCGSGGGAQLLTLGGVNIASDLKMYGGQIIAAGDVQFAANADGIEGASIISRRTISGTSNMTMGLCGSGMEDNFELDYYRIVG